MLGSSLRSGYALPAFRAKHGDINRRRFHLSNANPCPDEPGHRCLPQGSALASLAAEVSLRPILDAVEHAANGVMAASYGDNIIVLAPTAKAADASIEALRETASERISSHAVEGLCTRIERTTPAKGFFFVGSRFTLRNGALKRRRLPGFENAYLMKLAMSLSEHRIDGQGARRSLDGWLAANCFEPTAIPIAAEFRALWDLPG